jgi:hypothetical protein
VAGDYLDLLYVLPVAVCVNGFLWEGRGKRRFDDGVWCLFRAAPFIWCVHPPPFSWYTKKIVSVRKEQTGSSSGVFLFLRDIFLWSIWLNLYLISVFLFLFFIAWFWGTGHEQRRCTQPPIQSRW